MVADGEVPEMPEEFIRPGPVYWRAKELLEIDLHMAEALFIPSGPVADCDVTKQDLSMAQTDKELAYLEKVFISDRRAVAVLRYLAEHGVVDWAVEY